MCLISRSKRTLDRKNSTHTHTPKKKKKKERKEKMVFRCFGLVMCGMRRIPASEEERCFADQYKMAREGEGRRWVEWG